MPATFHIYRDSTGKYYFELRSSQNRLLLTSEPFLFRISCLQSISLVRARSSQEFNYQKGSATNGEHFFVLRGNDLEVLAISNFYPLAEDRNEAIEKVRNEAREAILHNE